MKSGALLEHFVRMRQRAFDAKEFSENLDLEQFLADRKTHQACLLNLLIIGECAARILKEQAAFADLFPIIPYRNMRGMRNHIVHGFSTLNLETIWVTLDRFLPVLIAALPDVIEAATGAEHTRHAATKERNA